MQDMQDLQDLQDMVSAARPPPGARVWPLRSQPFWLIGNGGGYPWAFVPCNPQGAGLMATPSTNRSAPAKVMWKTSPSTSTSAQMSGSASASCWTIWVGLALHISSDEQLFGAFPGSREGMTSVERQSDIRTVSVLGAQQPVAVAVAAEAVQAVDNQTVVFKAQAGGLRAVPVKTGRNDGKTVEVMQGLQAGEQVATTNAYVLKSELGKAGTDHGH